MKYRYWLLVPVVIIAMSSCRSTKKIQSAITKKDTSHVIPVIDSKADSMRYIMDTYHAVENRKINFRTFAAKVKVDFVGNDGKKSDFNANLRMYKDSMIWVSITALLGIEAFRVLITPDSVKVLNKLDKVVQLRSVGYLQDVAKIPLTFTDLQNILIGNPVYLDSNIVSYKRDERTTSLISIGHLFKHLLTVSNNDYLLQHSKLDDVDPLRARTCNITYGGYDNRYGFPFSTYRRIAVSEKSKLDIQLQFKQIDFNLDLNFPFNVPKNFDRQ